MIDDGFKLLAERWNPILDVYKQCGVKFALEVHPTEITFDIVTAKRALEALKRRPEFGLDSTRATCSGREYSRWPP